MSEPNPKAPTILDSAQDRLGLIRMAANVSQAPLSPCVLGVVGEWGRKSHACMLVCVCLCPQVCCWGRPWGKVRSKPSSVGGTQGCASQHHHCHWQCWHAHSHCDAS